MGSKSGVMLRVLLNRYYKNPADAPIRFLPQDVSKPLFTLDIHSKDPNPLLNHPTDQIHAIHYSWLLPAIQSFPKPLHPTLLNALSKSHAAKLRIMLHIPAQPHPESALSEPVRNLFLTKLVKKLRPEHVLPLEYLPDNLLSPLSKMTKQQLVEVIDFLGLYDLAEGIRHIIDKTFLQKLYLCLSHKQKQFLRICLHQHEKIAAAKMEMSTWDGSCKKLDIMLQRRGLLRLGKAFCGLHPDFVWHISHALDSGRGTILLHYFSEETPPAITARLVQQVTTLMNFLNPKSVQ